MSVKNWMDYRSEFSRLIVDMNDASLELQFGEGAEEWSVHCSNSERKEEFLKLSEEAGRALLEVHLKHHETGSQVSHEIRWFRFLREHSSPDHISPILFDKTGPALFQWVGNDVADLSAQLCAQLHGSSPISSSSNKLLAKFKQDPVGSSVKVIGIAVLALILLKLGLR